MQFTKYTGTITGQVGSLITALDAILVTGQGWTKVFTGTNKAVYQAPGGNQLYFRVDDNGPGAGGGKEARLTGYETMSDVDTGTGPFPTAAQGVGGGAFQVIRKSTTADATSRNYVAFADARTLYFCSITGDGTGTYYCFGFGEYYSFLADNPYRSFVVGRSAENSTNASVDLLNSLSNSITASSNLYIPRGYTGLGSSINASRIGDSNRGGGTGFLGTLPYPNPTDGGLYLTPVTLGDIVTAPINHLIGRMRGLWAPLHPIAYFNDGDTVSGTGEFAGKTFTVVKPMAGGQAGAGFFETSNTLETNA